MKKNKINEDLLNDVFGRLPTQSPLYRHDKTFKKALEESGFFMFIVDKFGYGNEDGYRGRENIIIEYLRNLYGKMCKWGKSEKENERILYAKSMVEIEQLREYI